MTASDPYTRSKQQFEDPPRGFLATIRHLGPGMILVGSVVGSGELIVTTKLGAVAGFVLLWFVLLSCLIKVVVQAELTRHTISSGKTFLTVFNDLPGPSTQRPAWLSLPWMSMVTLLSVVGVGVFVNLPEHMRTLEVGALVFTAVVALAAAGALAINLHAGPATTACKPRPTINWFTWLWLGSLLLTFVNSGAILGGAAQAIELAFPNLVPGGARGWSVIVAVVTGALLLSGSYSSLEKTFIGMVATFTLMTIVSTVLLQWTNYAVTWNDIAAGLTFDLPSPFTTPVLLAALAMYAGTGVAYGEMKTYTYWCVEKGYARNAGENQPGDEWGRRARGWIRVMYTDVWFTMLVYTGSTICFYLLGAAVLHANGLDPKGAETLATLGVMYTESLGDWAATLFVVGAFFVLFSTVMAGAAGTSRLLADGLAVMGIIDARDYSARLRYIRVFIIVSLLLFAVAYWMFENPPQMLVVTSSLIAAVMYPALGLGVLYLRYYDLDPRITPSVFTTTWLWICGLSLAVISPGGILLAMAIKFDWITLGV